MTHGPPPRQPDVLLSLAQGDTAPVGGGHLHRFPVLAPMSDEDMAVYRRPYLEPGESRRPTLAWPREIPIEGEPAYMVDVVAASESWLSGADVAKLFVDVDPGSIIGDRVRRLVRSWPNVTDVTVPGLHFVPEDSGDQIGRVIAAWMGSLV